MSSSQSSIHPTFQPSKDPVRVLFLSDTHLGLDWPIQPRIKRRRRGPEFFDNFDIALAPALTGEVDLVIHGGDVFFRSKINRHIVEMAVDRVLQVTDRGIPFIIVPGNHERAALPCPLLWHHKNLHVFDHPRSFVFTIRGTRLAVSGFPYCYDHLAQNFGSLLRQTDGQKAHIRLLVCHHIVEGARVGPVDYTFRRGKDVLPAQQIPGYFAAVLAGHVHRHQILTHDLRGQVLAAPVLYSGSTSRTSFAEKNEEKGYMVITLTPSESGVGKLVEARFRPLPSRPMVDVVQDVRRMTKNQLAHQISAKLAMLHCDSIVRLKLVGSETQLKAAGITDADLRRWSPETMNVQLAWNRLGP